MVKNPPANAGEMATNPSLGRSHMQWNNKTHMTQLLRLRSRAPEATNTKPANLEPMLRNKKSHRNEKPLHHKEEYPSLMKP